VLVVDDDVLMLRLVEQTLRAEGYRVWTAAHAAGARRLLDEHAGAVDLVLTDVAMPGGLGSELAAEIRTSRRWVRVLYMSAYSREELLSRGVDVGESLLLKKSSMPAQLLERVREAVA
jgi:DNA-binding response OmpR family regulator